MTPAVPPAAPPAIVRPATRQERIQSHNLRLALEVVKHDSTRHGQRKAAAILRRSVKVPLPAAFENQRINWLKVALVAQR